MAKKLIFNLGSISERAGSVSAKAYISALKKIYGIESIITYSKIHPNNSTSRITELVQEGFDLVAYKHESDLSAINKDWGAESIYFYSGGEYNSTWVKNTKKITHAMFANFEPHGDSYNYVSKWVYERALLRKKRRRSDLSVENQVNLTNSPYTINTSMPISWVPFIVEPKFGDGESFRNKIKIPKSSKLVGRIGGYNQFNDLAAQNGIIKICNSNSDIFFVLINTKKFYLHPRIIYIDYLGDDEKWDFYAASNLLLNGRLEGEGFGYSICEPLSVGKPILAPHFFRNVHMDNFHYSLIRREGMLYKSQKDFEKKIIQILFSDKSFLSLTQLVAAYKTDFVIPRFVEKFSIY